MENSRISKNIGLFGLTMTGLTCIIGSGWLFGSYLAAHIAGPAAIFSWIIGGVAMLFIALTYVELGAMFPRVGGMVHYMEYTHGSLVGFMSAWANWLTIITAVSVEAIASIQYLSGWHWQWTQNLYHAQTKALSNTGLLAAALLLVLYFLINFWSVRLFMRFVVIITVVKIAVPLLTIVLLLFAGFHSGNFTAYNHSFTPYGWAPIFTAVATSGIVFAMRGFQTIINLSGEVKNPSRNIPLSIIFSILFAMLLYIILQVVFIGAVNPAQAALGWHNLLFSSPYIDIALALNLHFLVLALYVDAFLSPSGTGITYLATTARMLYGMAENNYMPKFMTILHPQYKIPRAALWVNLFVSFLFLYAFKGWGNLVPVVSLTAILAYVAGPISVSALRHLVNDQNRPIRLPLLKIIAPIAFIVISLVLFWGRWPLTGKVILIIFSGLIIYIYYQIKQGWPNFQQQFKASIWFLVYLFAIAAISYLGSKQFGGRNIIPYGWDMLSVCVVALIIYYWGVKSAWMNPILKNIISKTGSKH